MKNILRFVFFIFLSHSMKGQEVDTLKQEPKKFAIYPALGYSPETHWNFGAIAFFVFEDQVEDEYHRPSSITPYAIYTSKHQILTKVEFDMYLRTGMNVNTEVRYLSFPDNYYGIGNETTPDSVELFNNNFFRLNGRIAKPFSGNLFAGLYYDFQYNSVSSSIENGMLDTDMPIGENGGRNMGLGPGMQYDSRNSTLYPTSGKLFNAGITFYSRIFGSEYDYTSFLLDYRQYFELLGPKNILAFQFRTELTAGSEIPFYKLPAIAGDQRLRGIEHRNLYIDQQSMYFQVEARQDLFWRFGGVVFAGVGEVFDSFSNFNTENLKFVYGLGGRFQAMRDQKLNIRLDLGFSHEGQHAVFLSVKEAF
ncbi:MAG: BamA/TamA family outer membrane protein [Reichenbachiella sp.]